MCCCICALPKSSHSRSQKLRNNKDHPLNRRVYISMSLNDLDHNQNCTFTSPNWASTLSCEAHWSSLSWTFDKQACLGPRHQRLAHQQSVRGIVEAFAEQICPWSHEGQGCHLEATSSQPRLHWPCGFAKQPCRLRPPRQGSHWLRTRGWLSRRPVYPSWLPILTKNRTPSSKW